ncbi:methyltransferase domain-containing protein [Paeniroseomonas aquatica]|uniref:Methyltransferase domain-containing protein n=1 Tax=Paeniroseomonas aquatica TaxID=373043 RepID=A0ABT8A2D0_9PROT|nr:methyltransferase domain-containing protein [Paeniroseomonas aquatica]MDN3563918.1 methyltransferase domain-containing protein [Paeniroseomonas aquatica]
MTLDAKAFTAFEQAAHDRIARPYAKHFAPLTSLALELLLDAARVGAGQRVLDVATGPGVAAGAAYGRGADVVGVDVSPGMLALAREAHSEPPRVCWRPYLLRGWGYDKEDVEPVFA